jgi:hypothetical protein
MKRTINEKLIIYRIQAEGKDEPDVEIAYGVCCEFCESQGGTQDDRAKFWATKCGPCGCCIGCCHEQCCHS